MRLQIKPSHLTGTLTIPSSKSHTIRAVLIASLAQGTSVIRNALMSEDGESALRSAAGIGAGISQQSAVVTIEGTGGDLHGGSDTIHVGNSGTSLRLFTAAAALNARPRTFDGDDSLRTRLMKPLLSALASLGASFTIHHRGRDIPFTIRGPLHGGSAEVAGISSQFLSALLMSCPYIPGDTRIRVNDLHERPYIAITKSWLDRMHIRYAANEDDSHFILYGNQRYTGGDFIIPGDFSSATFGAVAAAIGGGPITLCNLDWNDPQGDKEVFTVLERMGVSVQRTTGSARVSSDGKIHGTRIDCNAMPDTLPALAVLGCFVEGTTELVNVAQARLKECDRIAAMAGELEKMGAAVEQTPDGMILRQKKLKGARLSSHGDHRILMALALAGTAAAGETVIDDGGVFAVTYPSFLEDFKKIGARFDH